jgi:DNA invertase Pin-like site-specific DNA recombinase
MKALGYVRVSRVAGRDGDSFLSPELQRESIARVCQRERLELVDVLEELDRSGGDAARPLWNQAIERVEQGEVAAIVVWNLDRFSRSLVDALEAIGRIEAREFALHG